ncbi:hypothetical protein Tco_0821049 [Tanacetum coccineum]|uniref:Uncharacterized protein n=1 Tax=Tanacetum coccineum TaxID=301880 RepID=A0ABQ5AB83_9ASTR
MMASNLRLLSLSFFNTIFPDFTKSRLGFVLILGIVILPPNMGFSLDGRIGVRFYLGIYGLGSKKGSSSRVISGVNVSYPVKTSSGEIGGEIILSHTISCGENGIDMETNKTEKEGQFAME